MNDWKSTFDSNSKRIQLFSIQNLQTSSQNYYSSWNSFSMKSDSRENYLIWKIQNTFSKSRFDISIDFAILIQNQQQQFASQRSQFASLILNFDRFFSFRMIVFAEFRIEMSFSSKSKIRKLSRKRKNNFAIFASISASKTTKTTKKFIFTNINDFNKNTRAKIITLDKKKIILIQLCIKYSKSFEIKKAIKN